MQPIVGALIVEQIEDTRVQPRTYQRVDVVAQHSAAALANSMEHQSLFLLPVWRALGKSRVVTKARHLPKVALAAGALVVAVGVFLFVPADFSPGAKGTLEPQDKVTIWAHAAGTVYDVPIKHGDSVHAGDVLLRLRNWKLEDDLAGTSAKLSQDTTARDRHARHRLQQRGLSDRRAPQVACRNRQNTDDRSIA